jgi:membrane protease YdiL (CAAX protease family)
MIPTGKEDAPKSISVISSFPDSPDSFQPKKHQAGSHRMIALGEVVLCSGFPTQLAVALFLSVIGITSIGQQGGLSLWYVTALSLGDVVVLIALITYCLRRHGERLRDVFFGSRPQALEVMLGLLLIPLMVVVAATVVQTLHYFWPWLRNVPENPLEALINSPLNAFIVAFVAIVAGGLREELQRAFILRRFEQHLGGKWVGLIVFSTVFGLGHYIQGWDTAIATGILGAIWGAVFLVRRSVTSTMISHAGFNATEIVIAFFGASTL